MAHPKHRNTQGTFSVATAGLALLLLAMCAWYLFSSSTSSSRRQDAGLHPDDVIGGSRLQELLGCWQAPGLATNQTIVKPMKTKLQFQHYYVATSTIPGAGLGIFARHDLPKGFIWNVEDATPGSAMNFTRAQWDSISKMAGAFEAAGVQHHALFDLVSLIRRYSYYCPAADLMMVSLTGATLTNHATTPTPGGMPSAGSGATAAGRRVLHAKAHLLPPVASTTAAGRALSAVGANPARVFVPNSIGAWPQTAAAAAALAKELGVNPPSLREQCVLSHTLRDVKAGEELMEDYSAYDCPWPGCNSPTVEAVRKAALSKGAQP